MPATVWLWHEKRYAFSAFWSFEYAQAWPLFLLPYSPDLNPIEMAFAKLKQLLRSLNARTIDQLWRAIGSVCSVFTPDECWSFFRHCGYAPASS